MLLEIKSSKCITYLCFVFIQMLTFPLLSHAESVYDKAVVDALIKGNLSDIKKYAEKGGSVSVGDDRLINAVKNEQFAIVDYLITKGAVLPKNSIYFLKPNSEKFAATCPKVSAVKYLTNKGARIQDAYKFTSIFEELGMFHDKSCIDLARYLINNGGKEMLSELVDQGHGIKIAPIYGTVRYAFNVHMFLLYADNMDINRPININGETIFSLAARSMSEGKYSIDFLSKLISKGALVSPSDVERANKFDSNLDRALFLQETLDKQAAK